jgi:MFS family permease
MIPPEARPWVRYHFILWAVETAAWMLATTFIDTTTVLPTLMLALTGSPVLAGVMVSLRYAGQGWPQLIAASLLSGKARKPLYFMAVIPGRLLLLWPALLLLRGETTPARIVPAILIAYLAFWVSEGFSIVPWVDLVGKTIPTRLRGRLFATMHVVGGLLGVGAGLYVRTLLHTQDRAFPHGYGILFILALIALGISTAMLLFVREPKSEHAEAPYSTWALIRDIPNLLKTMPQFRRLVLLQALFGFSTLPAPLYILAASSALRESTPSAAADTALGVGVFLAIQTAGIIGGNTLWGHLSDWYGNRLLLRVLAISHAAIPLLAAFASLIAQPTMPPWGIYLLFAPTFFGFASLQGGTWMAMTNFVLELAPAHDRPAYIAVVNALNLPAIILPILGGVLVRPLGFHGIFLLAAVCLLGAVLLTRGLAEPREILLHHHQPPPLTGD